MPKHRNAQTSKSSSAFADLIRLHESAGPEHAAATAAALAPAPAADRKRGKSADAAYFKLTSYIRRETHLEMKRALLEDGREISELIEELLAGWLAARAGK